MRFEPYIKVVTGSKYNNEDLCRLRLIDSDVEYDNYHEHMHELGMIACHHYEEAAGQINGSQITGYELHLYNEYDESDQHKLVNIPYGI